MVMMKSIDWNKMSELGLIYRINKEILHPLGLAVSRTVETGLSEKILIADDGVWEYNLNMIVKTLTDDEIKLKLKEFIDKDETDGDID